MSIPPNHGDAILRLRPDARFIIEGDDLSGLTWVDETQERPTDEEIIATLEILEQEFAQQAYRRQRASSYPPIGDQLDALFHAGVFPEEMAARIQAVKDAYPKNETR